MMVVGVVFAVGLVLSASAALYRLVVGPTLADRIVALDFAIATLMCAIGALAAWRGEAQLLNLVVIVAFVGFTATVSTTRFIAHRSPPETSSAREDAT